MADVITLPIFGPLALGRCHKCGREILKRSLTRSGQCLICREANAPRASTIALRAEGGGMHLALVRPLPEQPREREHVSRDSPLARHRSLEAARLGFESELGLRLEAALAAVERRLELLDMLIEGHVARVAAMVAQLPDGVRPPRTCELDQNDKSPRSRPALDLAALAADPSWRPWRAFGEPPEQPSAAELAAFEVERARRQPAPRPPAVAVERRVEKRLARNRERDEETRERDRERQRARRDAMSPEDVRAEWARAQRARRSRLRAGATSAGSLHLGAAMEESMPKPVFYEYQGRQMRAAELAALPEAQRNGLNTNVIRLRLTRGLTAAEAIKEPRGNNNKSGDRTPPPVAKAKAAKPVRRSIEDETKSAVRSVASSIDPLTLLSSLGIRFESLGRSPRGQVVLFPEASA